MTKITIKPENIIINSNEPNNVLEIAIKNNINLPYGCKNGLCGACKCKVIAGDFKLENYNERVLTNEELEQGYTLLCKTITQSDLELYIPDLLNVYPVKILPVKVIKVKKMGNIAILKLKTPLQQKFEYYAGQYIEIILDGKHRSYSIANAYNNNEIEVHVKYHKGGIFSEYVWNSLFEGNILRVKGPLGNFRLSKNENQPIFVCTGTGFAPVKSMLEDCVKSNENRMIHLYWGNRENQDFYLLDELKLLLSKLNIKVNLCLSREKLSGFYEGYVTHKIKEDFTDLSNYEVYACGNLQMIEDVYELCTKEINLNRNNFYSDAFTPSI